MSNIIEEIIGKKPHLSAPMKFYEKTLKFRESVKGLPIDAAGPARVSYPREVTDDVFAKFGSSLELPEGTLSPLKQAMELGEIDFTRLPLGEVPSFSLPYPEDDLTILLFILSKPYFSSLRDACRLDGRSWEEGKCPVCNAQPALSWIGDEGKRQVSCSFCGTTGFAKRTACPVCLQTDRKKQNILVFDQEEGFKINTCELCHSYVKTIDAGIVARWSPEIADMISLPLDIVVQEKGFQRRAPNPIGMRKITAQG